MKYAEFTIPAEGILQITLTANAPDEAEFQSFLTQWQRWMVSHAVSAIVWDVRGSSLLPQPLRSMLLHWIRVNRDLFAGRQAKWFFATKHPWMKLLLQASFWLQKPPAPYQLMDRVPEAITEAKAHLLGKILA